MGRIWSRTNCNFDGNGRGKCQTRDCNGRLKCQGFGSPPNTLAEFALNQPNNLDFFDISLVDGFNFLWNSAQSTECVVISYAKHLLMINVQTNYGHPVGVTTREEFSRRMNFVVQMVEGHVVLLIFRNFSNKDVQMLIVIHWMIQQVCLHVLLVQITRLSSTQVITSTLFNFVYLSYLNLKNQLRK